MPSLLGFHRVLALSVVAVAGAADLTIAQGRALTIEDYYRVKTVGNPQMSPDARWVA